MAEIDSSIYKNQVQHNPFETMGAMANTMNAITQGKALQQNLAGQQAVAQAMEAGGGDPTASANALMNIGGKAGIYGPQAMEAGLAMKKQLLGLSSDQLDLGVKKLSIMNATALPALQDIQKMVADKTYTPEKAAQVLTQAGATAVMHSQDDAGNPIISPQETVNHLKMYDITDPVKLQEQMRSAIATSAMMQGHFEQALALKNGTPQLVDVGGQKLPMVMDPTTGQYKLAGGGIANTLSPEASATPTPVIGRDANGNLVQGQVPLGSIRTPTGAAVNTSPTAVDLTATGLVPAVSSTQLEAPLQRSGPMNPPGFVQTEFAPGYEQAKAGEASAGVANAQALMTNYNTIPQQKAILTQMEANLKDFSSGPAASVWKEIASATGQAFGVPIKSVASQEEFNKGAAMIAQQQFKALGGTGTNEQLGSAEHTSPNEALSKMGNVRIMHLLKGNADAIKAMGNDWITAQKPVSQGGLGLTSADYQQFVQNFQAHFDPNVFQLPYMSPDERKELLRGMTDHEKKVFREDINYAGQRGWLPDARKQNGQ